MKTRNEFKSYLIIWGLAVVIFHILVFIFKQSVIGDRYFMESITFQDGTYGVKQVLRPEFLNLLYSYIFVLLAFIGQLVCTKIFLSQESLKKTLYHYPIFNLSLRGLIITIIFAIVFCFVNLLPIISFVIFLFTLFFTIATCVSSKTAANMVSAKEENLEIKTQYLKLLRGEFDSLYNRIKDANEKNIVKEICDEVRFSDPISIPELMDIEKELIGKLDVIKQNINVGKIDELKTACADFSAILKDRNNKVKALKK